MSFVNVVTIGVICLMFGSQAAFAQKPVPPGFEAMSDEIPLPEASFTEQPARTVTLQSLKGKIVILNLWATWCGPCVQEMPALARLQDILPSDTFQVVAVSQDKGGLSVSKPFLKKLDAERIKPYADPLGNLARALNTRGLPSTFIISSNGVFIARVEGALQWDSEEVINYLESLE